MAASKKYIVLLMMYIFAVASCVSSSSSLCHPESNSFTHDLKFQCPLSISFTPPLRMDGESLEIALRSSPMKVNTAVLFYASWCPFSSGIQSKFGALSSMFPQIKHVMVEESSALPSCWGDNFFRRGGRARLLHIGFLDVGQSGKKEIRVPIPAENRVFSRYGIHSLPSILMVNQTGKVQYHGSKDLPSLVHFYKRTTGLDPVVDVVKVQISSARIGHRILQPWNHKSLKERFTEEPYLVLSMVFLFLKAFIYLFPEIVSRLKALWVAYAPPHLSLGVFGESSQLLGRVLHLIDVKRICIKLKLWKSRKFHDGARKARVLASSLASVSLGEAPSSA